MLYALRNQELHFFTDIVSFWGKWLPNKNIQYNYKQDVDSLRASTMLGA
jgi:phage anti-repressor protein